MRGYRPIEFEGVRWRSPTNETFVSGGNTTTLNYDAEGRVTSISYPGGSSNSFVYNGLDTRVSKTDSTGTKTYERDGAYVTDPVLSDGTVDYTPGISQRTGSTTTFEVPDRLGTISRQTATTQLNTGTRTHDAFGVLDSTTGAPKAPFGFAGNYGYQEDPNSRLKLLGHRYYDPSTGRFLTRDPIKDGRNWYVYCDNNPLNRVDENGLDWHNPGWLHVHPKFKGEVWIVGEPGRGQSQIWQYVRPGYVTHPSVDADLVIIIDPNGRKREYF